MNIRKIILWNGVFLMLLQTLCNNYLDLSVYIKILIFPIFILNFPLGYNRILLLIIAFVSGLLTDLMSNDIMGLYTASILPVALLRSGILSITASKRDFGSYDSNNDMAEIPMSSIIPYYLVSLLIFHVLYFSFETFFSSGSMSVAVPRFFLSYAINSGLTILLTTYIFKR